MTQPISFDKTSERFSGLITSALRRNLPPRGAYPPEIHEAMRYACLDGGKRFRPVLVLAACEAVGGDPKQALLPACAVELIHAYSLVHDDLPALDNDELRRGKPSCHKQFGEALAILTGDALLTHAFQLLSRVRPAAKAVQLMSELSYAAGSQGMIGGQVADIQFARGGNDVAVLDYISQHKTGRLIQASAVLGAVMGTGSQAQIQKIRRYGQAVGFAFQVVDDIMDADGYLRLMDPEEARRKAASLIQKAKHEAETLGKKSGPLLGLADFLLERMVPNYAAVDSKN